MLIFTSCTPPNDVGKDVLPGDDFITGQYVDTFQIRMKTILIDSVQTDKRDPALLGNYVDEEFGHLFAETYFQTRITGSNLKFGDDPSKLSVDSVVLRLDLTGFYGRYNDVLPLDIFAVTEEFPEDDMQSSVSVLNYDASYDYANGYEIDFSALPGFLDFIDIRLDDSLGRKLLFADTDSLINNVVFSSFFNGLVVRSKPADQSTSREPGAIFRLDLDGGNTFLTLHYKDSTEAKSYGFDVNSVSERFFRITRNDYQGRLLDMAIADSLQATAPYGAIQAGGLVNLYVGVSGLMDIDPAGINRAELILPVDTTFFGSGNRFQPPAGVAIYIANESGNAPEDPNVIASTATFNPATNSYSISLTNNLQNILAGRLPDNGFIIVPSDQSTTVNRAVIAGPGHPFLQPKFRVVYTTLPGGG